MNRITFRPDMNPATTVKPAEVKREEGDLFRKTLESAMTPTSTPAPEAPTGTLPPLGPPAVRGITALAPASPEPVEIRSRTEALVSELERFSGALCDPRNSLKDLEPIANRLEDQALELSKTTDNADPGLQDIASRSALLASVEVAKFKRGDYI